jgi:putative iron-regulated protein
MCFDRRFFLLPKLVLVCMLSACNPADQKQPEINISDDSDPAVTPNNLLKFDSDTALSVQQIFQTYLSQVSSNFSELGSSLDTLLASTNALLLRPTDAALTSAQESWSIAHTLFEQTAVHRYFSYRISSEDESLRLFQLHYQMHQWPILAGYIDSVEGYMESGIVHDINVDLTAETLRQQHGLFDVTEATLGFHVFEFLLWGEPGGTSQRIAEDFRLIETLTTDQQENGLQLSQLGNNRRREMLRLTSGLLLEDFESSALSWRQAIARFESLADDISSEATLSLLLNSASSMITQELLAKSLYPMLNNEFEVSLQSPYSQTSQSAVAAQMHGVESLILETPANDGTTLDTVLVSLSKDFEGLFYQNLDASKACLVLLYNRIGASDFTGPSAAIEFETVECINLLTNLVDQLNQIELTLPAIRIAI